MKIKFLLLFALFFNLPLHAQHWQPFEIDDLPQDYAVWAISVVNEDVVWGTSFDRSIIGSIPLNHIPKVIKTTDGGANWDVYDVPGAIGRISYDITAFGTDTAFITTQDRGNGQGRGVFKTTDGGATWTEIYHHPAAGVWLRFFDKNEAIVINRNNIAKTYSGGEDWQLIDASNFPPFGANEYTILGNGNNSCIQMGNHIWFQTSGGRVYHSSNKGESWTASSVGLTDPSMVYSLTFLDTLRGIALVADPAVIDPSHLAYTEDGGETWTPYSSNMGEIYSTIAHIPGTDSSFLVTGDAYYLVPVVYSFDYCNTYTQTLDIWPIGPVVFLSPTIGWAARDGAMSSTGVSAAMFKWDSDLFLQPSQINEIPAQVELSVSPNPFSSHIQISLEQGLIPLSLEIQSIDGKLTRQISLDQFPSIDLSSLPAGAYLLRATTDKGIAVRMVVKS